MMPFGPLNEEARQQIVRACKSNGVMMVMFWIEPAPTDGGKNVLHLYRVKTGEFPQVDYNGCVNGLRDDLLKEVKPEK